MIHIIVLHLHTLFDTGIASVLDVLLSALNNREESLVGTGPSQDFEMVLDMTTMKGMTLMSDMACIPLSNFQYSTDVDMGALNSAPPTHPYFNPLCR